MNFIANYNLHFLLCILSGFDVAFYGQQEILIFAFIIADGSDAVQTAKSRGDHNGKEEASRMRRKTRLRFIHKIPDVDSAFYLGLQSL